MQVEEQDQEKLNAITHSPYYGCSIRVVSKVGVSYEGVLDGISTNKDRIFLKNVHVNGKITASANRDELHPNSTSDTLNAVMIDHLTNDSRTYEQVCLNVGDIQELRLIQLPSTFHESKAKLRAIDPCLVDIRLSSSDAYEARLNGLNNDRQSGKLITQQKRGESFGSSGGSALISSSSNESSSSFDSRPGERFANESNDESIEEQIEQLRHLTTTTNSSSKPATLLAKKILPKKIERRLDGPVTSSINTPSDLPSILPNRPDTIDGSARVSPHGAVKRVMVDPNRNFSPVRVTITSKLNPNATPFFTQQGNTSAMGNPTFKFYDRPRFRPRLPPVASPDRSQSIPYGINTINNQQQQEQHRHQRFVPPRQMANKTNFTPTNSSRTNTRSTRVEPTPLMRYRLHLPTSVDKRIDPQDQQQKEKTMNNGQVPKLMQRTSLPMPKQLITPSPSQERLSLMRNTPTRRSTASIHSTASLPFHYDRSNDRNQIPMSVSFGGSIGSNRGQRTYSSVSSCSSLSLDMGSHSIVQFDLSSNTLPPFEEQYDFEKANEEFRRYLELEELVARCPLTHDDHSTTESPKSQGNSYKKEISFFDRISCTATTGTAVGYTEIDETEKNLETFGDAALLVSSFQDDEWQVGILAVTISSTLLQPLI